MAGGYEMMNGKNGFPFILIRISKEIKSPWVPDAKNPSKMHVVPSKQYSYYFLMTVKISYQELFFVASLCFSLAKKGVQKGDRVAIMLPNCPQYVITDYESLTTGAIIT